MFPHPSGSMCSVMYFNNVLLGLQARNVFTVCEQKVSTQVKSFGVSWLSPFGSVTIVFSHSPPVLPKDFEFLCGAEQVNRLLLYNVLYAWKYMLTSNSYYPEFLLCYWLVMCCSGVCLVVMWPRLSWCSRVWQRWRPQCWWFRGLRNPSVLQCFQLQMTNRIYIRLSVDYSAAIHVSWLTVRQRPLYWSDATSHWVF